MTVDNFFFEIRKSPLFKGLAPNDLEKTFKCLSVKKTSYKKGEIIANVGDKVDYIGWIMRGSIVSTLQDYDGNTATLFTNLSAPSLVWDTLACAEIDYHPALATASEDCDVLYINYKKLMAPCPSACTAHLQIIMNILFSVSSKSFQGYKRIAVLSKTTVRQKILLFLELISAENAGAKKFAIPYSREGMAQYLCVNQSALSKELRRMSEDGVLRFKRNEFELL